jgi:hypothetical protein
MDTDSVRDRVRGRVRGKDRDRDTGTGTWTGIRTQGQGHIHGHITSKKTLLALFEIVFKGVVQRKTRRVENSINRQVLFQSWGAGYFILL